MGGGPRAGGPRLSVCGTGGCEMGVHEKGFRGGGVCGMGVRGMGVRSHSPRGGMSSVGMRVAALCCCPGRHRGAGSPTKPHPRAVHPPPRPPQRHPPMSRGSGPLGCRPPPSPLSPLLTVPPVLLPAASPALSAQLEAAPGAAPVAIEEAAVAQIAEAGGSLPAPPGRHPCGDTALSAPSSPDGPHLTAGESERTPTPLHPHPTAPGPTDAQSWTPIPTDPHPPGADITPLHPHPHRPPPQ